MRLILLLFSLSLLAYGLKGERDNETDMNHLRSFFALSGSGSIDINPILDLDDCNGSGTINLNFDQDITDIILWNDGSTEIIRNDLPSGEYSVDLTIDGCDTTLLFALDFPETLMASVTNARDKNCVEGTIANPSFGSFQVAVSGGDDPYSYSLNGQPFGFSSEFTNLPEGDYTVDILDANGCQAQVFHSVRCIGCHISGNPVIRGNDFFVDVFFGDETETAELSIYNSNGRRVVSGIDVPLVNGEVNSFPVTADLEPGMYVVLIAGDSISFSRQLVVIE